MTNKEIANILRDISKLLEINSIPFKPRAYLRAAQSLENLSEDVSLIYKNGGLKALEKIPGVGKSIAAKIAEYLKKKKIKYYEELKQKTAIREIVTYYFETKGISLEQLKRDSKKRKIIYSRFTKPAQELLVLSGSVNKAKEAIKKVAEWAKSRNLDYAIETVFKKWLELDKLKPKEIVKKPYYHNNPMVWSETRKKWYVISDDGEWLEFAGKLQDIEWRIIK
jgi:Holliday junction resolvasome RuvABC DNA-binding subunit